MSRYTEPIHRPPTMIRDRDAWIYTACQAAVTRAMHAAHQENPAGFHARRPLMSPCPYDPHCPFVWSVDRQ